MKGSKGNLYLGFTVGLQQGPSDIWDVFKKLLFCSKKAVKALFFSLSKQI